MCVKFLRVATSEFVAVETSRVVDVETCFQE